MSALDTFAADRAPDGLRVLRQHGWTASLVVSPVQRLRLADAQAELPVPKPTVDMRAWRRLSKTSRIAVDFTNLLGREAAPIAGHSLLEPAPLPGRGVFIRFRKTF